MPPVAAGALRSQIANVKRALGPQRMALCVHGRSNQDREVTGAASTPAIQQRILVVRERYVMLDEDLAVLYGVQTRRLIE